MMQTDLLVKAVFKVTTRIGDQDHLKDVPSNHSYHCRESSFCALTTPLHPHHHNSIRTILLLLHHSQYYCQLLAFSLFLSLSFFYTHTRFLSIRSVTSRIHPFHSFKPLCLTFSCSINDSIQKELHVATLMCFSFPRHPLDPLFTLNHT